MVEEPARTRNKAKTQQRLLAAARELFYGDGVCATGVSAVAERAGVTKMTLYAHFPSKEELVTAYLEDSDRRCPAPLLAKEPFVALSSPLGSPLFRLLVVLFCRFWCFGT